jgi:hypothetical protein
MSNSHIDDDAIVLLIACNRFHMRVHLSKTIRVYVLFTDKKKAKKNETIPSNNLIHR